MLNKHLDFINEVSTYMWLQVQQDIPLDSHYEFMILS